MLHYVKEVRNEWFMFGIALGVPLTKLREIEALYTKEGLGRCKLEMAQYWLDTTPAACWEQVARALEQVNQLTLAATIKQKYLCWLRCNTVYWWSRINALPFFSVPQESEKVYWNTHEALKTILGLIPTYVHTYTTTVIYINSQILYTLCCV